MSAGSPGIFLAETRRTRPLCREHFEVTLAVDHFPDASPGQFLQVLCHAPQRRAQAVPIVSHESSVRRAESHRGGVITHPMLRRPFSLAGLRRESTTCEIDLIGRVVGSGTKWLSRLRAGDIVDILGPLGHGFTPPPPGRSVLLLSGGVGWPPIRWWGHVQSQRGVKCEAICGAQTRDLLPFSLCRNPCPDGRFMLCGDEFSAWGIPMMVTTDDGSCGMRGRVTDGLLRHLAQAGDPARLSVYACGPESMLNMVASICDQHGAACEVAMERLMGCGMGTCQSCVLPLRNTPGDEAWHYALCCTDGPVFDARRVIRPGAR